MQLLFNILTLSALTCLNFIQDRPDIMAKYTCYIEADKAKYPVLLSNGNLVEQGNLEVSFFPL